MANSVKFNVGFSVDKSALDELKTSLREVQNMANTNTDKGLEQQLKQAASAASQLEKILNQSWNSKLNQLDLSKVSQGINETYGGVSNLRQQLVATSSAGTAAFNQFASTVLNTNLQLKESSKILDDFATTFKNTVRYGISSSIFNNLSNSLRQAFDYTVKLDTSLNEIRIVSEKSADDMERFARQANEAAKSLGASTLDYTGASVIYYQQGLNDEEVAARAETTLKAANVTGQSGEDVSEQLTAIWNGYKVSAEEAELYIDKVTKVAATTASDLNELATGMSKVASAAASAGVDIDQLNATLATVISVTREAPETIGTAFRSIYARLGDLALDGEDEFGVSLGTVSGQLEELGIQILDEQGQMRDMGDIIEDTAAKWQTWTQAQRQAAAVAMAGKQQYSRLIALFDNWDMYESALTDSQTAAGALNEQQDIYMESTEAHLQKLGTTAEETYDILFDQDLVNGMVDALTNLLSVFNLWMDGVGGGLSSLIVLGTNLTNIFNKQIASGISGAIQNYQGQRANEDAAVLKQNIITDYQSQGRGNITEDSYGAGLNKEVEIASKLLGIKEQISSEEYNYLTSLQKESGLAAQKLADAENWSSYLTDDEKKQNASLRLMERHRKALEEQNKEYNERLADLEEINNILGNIEMNTEDGDKYSVADDIEELLNREGEMTKAFSMSGYSGNDIQEWRKKLESGDLNQIQEAEEQFNAIREKYTQAAIENEQHEQNLTKAIQQRNYYESESYQNLLREQNARDRIIQQAEEQAKREAAIANAIQGVSALVGLLTTAVGIISTLNDDSLSGWEKFTQIGTTLLMSLPLLITSLNSLNSLLPSIAISLGATKIGLDASAASALKATVSIMGMKMALWEVFAIVGIVVAAIAGVVAIVNAVSDAYNAEAIEAKKAAEAAKELQESNEAVQQSYQDLQSAFDAYDTAVAKLEQCVKGTEEWKQALDEVNSAAVSAIEAIPDGIDSDLIAGLYHRDEETGQIVLDQDKMADIENAAQLNAASSQLAATMGNYNATIASNQSQMLNTTRDLSDASLNMTDAMGFATNGLLGVGIANETEAQIIQDRLIANLEEFSEAMTTDEFRDKLQALGMDVSSLSNNELEEYKNKVIELANSTEAANEQMKLLAGMQVDDILGDDFDAATRDVVTNQLTEEQQKLAQEIEDKLTGSGISQASGSGNKIYQDIANRLQEATNGQYRATTGNTVLGSDSNRRFIFEDANGEKTEEKTAKWVAQTIAAYEAMEEVGVNAEEAQKAFEGLEAELGEGISDGLKNFVTTGNLESLTQEDYQKLLGFSKEDLMKAMNITDDEEFDQMFGEYGYDKFKESIEDYGTALDDFTKNMVSSARETFEDIDDTEDLSLSGKKAIAEALEDALVYSGEEAMSSMSDMFNRMDSTDLKKFTDVTSEISNWGDVSLSSLKEQLEEAGIATDLTDEELKEYIEIMREATGATQDFNSLSKTYGEIHEIIDELATGDTISAENYEKLGSVAEGYFTKMLDGTYKLIGDANTFYDAVQNEQIEKFSDALDSQREQLNKAQKFSQIDYDQEALNELSKSQYNNGVFGIGASVDEEDVKSQLAFIEAFSENQKEVARLKDRQERGVLEREDYDAIAEEVENCTSAYKNLDDTIKNTNASILENEIALLSSARDLEQLKEIAESSDIEEDSVAYQQAELNLHEAEKWEDIDSDEIEDYAKHLREVADSSDELADSLEDDKEGSRELARQIIRMNQGIEDLADGWEDWSDILKNSSRESEEYAEALSNTQEALADILDTSVDYVSEDFVKEHMEEIGKAAEGDAEAIDNLHKALARQIVLDIAVENGLDTETQNNLLNQIDTLQNQLPDLEVGASIDGTQLDQDYADFQNTLASLIEQSGMTADQVNALLGQMGYEADFETEEATIPQKVPVTISETTMEGMFPPKFTTRTYQDGYETINQTVQVPKITSTVDGKKSLNISKISRKASGSINNYSSSNKGGGSPGSSGGSSKAQEPDFMDYIDDEKDRYHDIDIILKQIQNDMDILDKQKDKLFGQDLIDNLNKQLALLDDQIDATNEKISIANGEVSELQSKLAGKGVTFNADGTIANYASAYQAQLAYVNSLIAQYNSMSAEAQEGFKDTVEKAQEDFETFVSNIERYDELITDTIPGLEADIQDAINEQIEIQIEQFNMEIEIRLNLAEAERDWNEFKKRIIDGIDDEDILGNASARLQDFYSYYKDDENGIIQANTRHVEDILQQLYQMDNTGWSDVYGDNRNQALEDLQTYYEQLMSDMNDLQDLQEEIHEAYLDMMDEAQDKFDEQIETYETISDLIEHDMNVISLVSGDESYTELAKYYEMQEDNYNKQLDFQRQQVDFWEQQMNTLEKGSDEWESAKEKWMDAVSEWNSMVEEAIENLQDKYLNAINKIFQDLNNQVTNGLGLDYVEEEWNLINENADQYLDTVNSLYEVQKLENKYLDALDETDSISARRELKEIMDEELEDLREKDKLTQYDIDRANMRYEIALKQIALEEAQQNKTTMRLRRDSQGNYSYQYVADDDAVADAQDELNDLYNSLYNFDKENYQENLNQLYEIWAEFQEKMAEAAQINDPNARAERELLLQEQYGELINGLVEQNETIRSNLRDSAFEDLARLYEIDVSNFQNMSDEEQEILMSDLIPYWDSGVQHMADVFAGEGGFLGVCQEAFEQLHDATKDYEDGLTDLETTAGISFDNINDGIDDAIFKTEDLLNKNDELINAYQEEMDAIASVISQLDSLIAKYTAAKNEAIAATEAAYKYWVQEQQRAANAAAGNSSGGSGGSGSSSGSGSGYGGSGSGSGRSGDGNLTVGDVATYSGSYYYDSYGTAPSGSRYSGVAGGIVVDKINNNPYGVHIHSSDGKFRDLGWVKKSQLTGYESGGYTGDWAGESGRLALLHQKELVLNANDTSNILNAVQILRDITDTIGSSILAKMSAITANTSIGGNLGETFEQNVHIDANFPNVTNSKEIENAIDNLMNVATQRANRR